jgi:hypothetical protein
LRWGNGSGLSEHAGCERKKGEDELHVDGLMD